jgi:hypothetical protein
MNVTLLIQSSARRSDALLRELQASVPKGVESRFDVSSRQRFQPRQGYLYPSLIGGDTPHGTSNAGEEDQQWPETACVHRFASRPSSPP